MKFLKGCYLFLVIHQSKKVLNWKPKQNIDYLDDMINFELKTKMSIINSCRAINPQNW